MIFEEYGRAILAVIVATLLLGLIFGGIKLHKVIGGAADVDTSFNHSQSEQAVSDASKRKPPQITVPDAEKLHLYVEQAQPFKPLDTISCVNHEGENILPVVTSIAFVDGDGLRTDYTEDYDKEAGELNIAEVIDQTGVLVVTFRATDGYNSVATKTVSYVVDAGDGSEE